MKNIFILFLMLLSTATSAQNGYIFKANDIEITFPKKPVIDTTVKIEDSKVRVIISKDSLSNYYLSFSEKINGNILEASDEKSIHEFYDGFMDSQKPKNRAETISKKAFMLKNFHVVEYFMKGFIGQKEIFIKSWITIKNQKVIVCQHLYPTVNDLYLKAKSEVFFQSLML